MLNLQRLRLPAPLSRPYHLGRRWPAVWSLLLLLLLLPPVFAGEPSAPEHARAVANMLEVIRGYGFSDEKILKVMAKVPRHRFVPEKYRSQGYRDTPLDIGYGHISQPYIVAEMTSQLRLRPASKVLEIGTGSGYQAAVLAEITPQVYSVEIIAPLLNTAEKNLRENGYDTVRLRHADGYYGWPEAAPFDAIIVTCATGQVPPSLLEQLAPGGRMIIPVGKRFGTQYLILISKQADGTITSESLMAVRFVPMVRE